MQRKITKKSVIFASLLLIAGLTMTLFRRWEPSGESWGYWLFARILADSGKFIIVGRSPLYVFYLALLRWIEYPYVLVVEYILTSAILTISLVVFLRPYFRLPIAAFSIFLWLPFFQGAEPPVQKLALACSCLAVALRVRNGTRFNVVLSYSLLLSAYMFRSTYALLIAIFLIWDIKKVFQGKKIKHFLVSLHPKIKDWPLFVVVLLLVWINIAQSPSVWNNGWFANGKWFPGDGKTLADASFLQHYNWQYIYYKYGNFDDKDLYFTNQEVFDGADNIFKAIAANPIFVAKQLARNIKKIFYISASFTMFPKLFYENKSLSSLLGYLLFILFVIPFLGIIVYGAFRASKNEFVTLFIIGNVLLIGTVVLSLPKARYMFHLIPILMLSASWYATKITQFAESRLRNQFNHKMRVVAGNLISCFVLIFFSNGLTNWPVLINDFVGDLQQNDLKIMQARPYSMKASFSELKPLVRNCKGVLSAEHTFVGAFMDLPLSAIHDIWEIPPFGYLGNSQYDNLRPDCVDCLLVSQELTGSSGYATNSKIRYLNYVLPYMKQLQSSGAKTYDIKEYGQAVILDYESLE